MVSMMNKLLLEDELFRDTVLDFCVVNFAISRSLVDLWISCHFHYYSIVQLYSQFSASYLLKYTKTIIILDCSNSLTLRKFNTYTK